jgi:choline dehydrogenase-like flavoprotein
MRKTQQAEYDVCIVGSGAGGGWRRIGSRWVARRVVLLEAGGWWTTPTANSAMLKWPYQSSQRGARHPIVRFGEFDACVGGWDLPGEPFTRAEGTSFSWWRARMLGGRTNHWGRISLRFGPDDFKRKSIDGWVTTGRSRTATCAVLRPGR